MRQLSNRWPLAAAAFIALLALGLCFTLGSGTASAAPASQPSGPTTGAATTTITGTATLTGTLSKSTGTLALAGSAKHTGTLTQPVVFSVTGTLTPSGKLTVTSAATATEQFTLTAQVSQTLPLTAPVTLTLTGEISTTGDLKLSGTISPTVAIARRATLDLTGTFELILPAPAAAPLLTTAPFTPTLPNVWLGELATTGAHLWIVLPGVPNDAHVEEHLTVEVKDLSNGKTLTTVLTLSEAEDAGNGTKNLKYDGVTPANHPGRYQFVGAMFHNRPILAKIWDIKKGEIANTPQDTGTLPSTGIDVKGGFKLKYLGWGLSLMLVLGLVALRLRRRQPARRARRRG